MNKYELVSIISSQAELSKTEAEKAVTAIFDSITGSLKKGDKVTLVGFGTFDIAKRSARQGKNPRTGETIKIKATTIPRFRAGKDLKSAVNK